MVTVLRKNDETLIWRIVMVTILEFCKMKVSNCISTYPNRWEMRTDKEQTEHEDSIEVRIFIYFLPRIQHTTYAIFHVLSFRVPHR